jgi:hypothetical protein
LVILIPSGIIYFQYQNYRTPIAVDQTIERKIVNGLANEDAIPSVTEPIFESVASADVYLDNDGLGLVYQLGSRARFYPFQILSWHEAVNDTLAGKDILVTYSPLTFTSAVYEREFDNQVFVFNVSGKVMDSNTLLSDNVTGSLWLQATGEAVQGDLEGTKLSRLESRVMSWTMFKEEYPYAEVLSRETGVDRDYTQNPYEEYDSSAAVWFPLSHEDGRLSAKTIVYCIVENGEARAYTSEAFGAINDQTEPSQFMPAYWFAWAAIYPDTKLFQ